MIDEIRKMGHDILENWSKQQINKKTIRAESDSSIEGGGKKNFIGIQRSVK
ncbi:hypothetical protein WDW89_18035 [Deltaproteobacteria bacterium TL4]